MVAKAKSKVETREIHKPDSALAGTPLFALTVANLRICGLFAAKASATASAILAPYASGSMLRQHHKVNGHFSKDEKTGRYSLTAKGKDYFSSRADGSRTTQQVTEEQVAAATKALLSGGEFSGVKFSQKITVKI